MLMDGEKKSFQIMKETIKGMSWISEISNSKFPGYQNSCRKGPVAKHKMLVTQYKIFIF